jgi:hypothetical protein
MLGWHHPHLPRARENVPNDMKCSSYKVAYKKEDHAWRAAYKVYLKLGKEQSPYLCRECAWYHLTTRTGKVPKWLEEEILKS